MHLGTVAYQSAALFKYTIISRGLDLAGVLASHYLATMRGPIELATNVAQLGMDALKMSAIHQISKAAYPRNTELHLALNPVVNLPVATMASFLAASDSKDGDSTTVAYLTYLAAVPNFIAFMTLRGAFFPITERIHPLEATMHLTNFAFQTLDACASFFPSEQRGQKLFEATKDL